jgi:hypothetical protein
VLLLIEYGLGGENTPALGKTIDVVMLTITAGKERTVEEHRELLASTGFWLNQTISLCDNAMLLEAKRTLDKSIVCALNEYRTCLQAMSRACRRCRMARACVAIPVIDITGWNVKEM